MNKPNQNIQKIAIIGMGYVGIPLCKSFLEAGIKVIGIDICEKRIDELNKNKVTLNHLSKVNFDESLKNKDVRFSTNFQDCELVDSILICVPTPLNEKMHPDLSCIRNVISSVKPYIKKGQTISLESTTYPGTTREEIVLPLEEKGMIAGNDFFVVYSPEREDPGNAKYNCKNTPKVIGGYTQNCLDKGVNLYSNVVDTLVEVSSCEVAEFTKLYENIYRAVNIGLANEMKIVADSFGIDIFEIIRAAATKPFGFSAFYPGPGVGGHCIPVDPEYLNWKARALGSESKLVDVALKVNREVTKFVIKKTLERLEENGKSISSSKILILGLSYKSNIDDIRESPSLDIVRHLLKLNAEIFYDDKYVTPNSLGDITNNVKRVSDSTLTEENISMYDAILILTNHDYYNNENILMHGEIVVDTRGIFSSNEKNVVRG